MLLLTFRCAVHSDADNVLDCYAVTVDGLITSKREMMCENVLNSWIPVAMRARFTACTRPN